MVDEYPTKMFQKKKLMNDVLGNFCANVLRTFLKTDSFEPT